MSEVMELLQLEHRSITRVLDLLEEQCTRLAAGGAPDPTLVRVGLAYLAGFPEECHHPKEDLVFRLLQARAPEAVAAQADLESSHDRLAAATAQVCEAAASIDESQVAGFSEKLVGFIDAYRRHMAAEERDFFPAVAAALTDDDFSCLELRLFDRCDPLIEPRTEAEFHGLQRELQRLASRPRPRPPRTTGRPSEALAPLLVGTASIADANDALAPHDYRLAPVDRGYALEWKERPLTEVPASDETRVVWCTHYFLRGLETGA